MRFCFRPGLRIAVALLCVATLAPTSTAAQDAPAPRDRVAERLDRAETNYHEAVARAADRLVDALNEAVYRAADKGDLDELEEIEAQREAFEEVGELPASLEVRRDALAYHRAVERAGDDLARVYDRAIRDYTRERRIDRARALRTRLALLRLGITLEIVAFEGGRYALIEETKSWDDAKAYCESLGGTLVCVGSAEENAFVQSLIPEDSGCWLGATDEGHEGDWRWVDGSDFEYEDWERGQPDNYEDRQHHMVVKQGGRWDDFWPRDASADCFICEWPSPDFADEHEDTDE